MLVYSKEMLGGTQDVYSFENGFGASVVRHEHSYGGKDGLFELAVIAWGEASWEGECLDGEDWEVIYDTEITNDVIGCLTAEAVQELLTRIEALEPRSHA